MLPTISIATEIAQPHIKASISQNETCKNSESHAYYLFLSVLSVL